MLGIFVALTFIVIIFSKQISIKNINLSVIQNNLSNIDISEPKFAISNDSKKIHIIQELPRNTMGKVLKNVLRDLYKDEFRKINK